MSNSPTALARLDPLRSRQRQTHESFPDVGDWVQLRRLLENERADTGVTVALSVTGRVSETPRAEAPATSRWSRHPDRNSPCRGPVKGSGIPSAPRT